MIGSAASPATSEPIVPDEAPDSSAGLRRLRIATMGGREGREVGATDWYRTSGWTIADQEHFERKLARARKENRAEYLRIKGLALEKAGTVEAARTLFVRAVLVAGRDRFTQSPALEHLAASVADDDPAEAERLLRRLLDLNPTLNNTSHMAEIRLAEILVRRGTPEALSEAREHLNSWDARDVGDFSVQLFDAAVARARWNEVAGDPAAASEWASCALELADVESPFPNAPGLAVRGLDAGLSEWLTDLARRSDAAEQQ